MRMRIAVLHVDYAFHAPARDDGRRKESLVSIFGKVAEKFEARVVVSLPRDGEQALLARYPPRQSFGKRQLDAAHGRRMHPVGCSEDQLFTVQQIKQAGVAFHELYH